MPFTREISKKVKLEESKVESQRVEKANSSQKETGVVLLVSDKYT